MLTTPVLAVGNAKLRFKFLIVETPPNPLPNFVANPISIPLLTIKISG
jgi:hypothetical protein